MKTLAFNINSYVRFKLSPVGEDIYQHSGKTLPCDEYGYLKAPLHQVMHIFGEFFCLGSNTPIQDMVILLDVKDLKQWI